LKQRKGDRGTIGWKYPNFDLKLGLLAGFGKKLQGKVST
jgi:hypothetical protein